MTPQENAERIDREVGPELAKCVEELDGVANSRLGRKLNYIRLLDITDKVNELTAHYVPCKSGCAHCCHVGVSVHVIEAEEIARFTGRKRESPTGKPRDFTGQRCTFLGAQNECTIYPVRPLICRTLLSIEETSEPCDQSNGKREVGCLNTDYIKEVAQHTLFYDNQFGDIREFFPSEQLQKP